MKNTIRIFGIAAIVAVFVLSMIACTEDTPNPKKIPTNFKFRNEIPPASLNVSVARTVMGGTTTDTASYSDINAYYTSLGGNEKIVQKVSPAAFKVYEGGFVVDITGMGLQELDQSF